MHTLIALPLVAGLVGSAHAVTALIDFGTANAPSPYNTVPITFGADADTGIVALNDTSSAATGWSVNVSETGTGNGGNAGAGANVSSFPASLSSYAAEALQDSIYANQGGGTTPSMVLTLSGLNSALTYDLLLYGSRANGQGVDQIWNITQGTGGATVTHFSELNDTTVVDWQGVSPNGSGVIEVSITAGADAAGALALNFGSITENAIPEPSAGLLCALAGLALVKRRRS
ncbi:MAG: hypothetical protein ACSHYF_04140 [Verrucomicrobiaceae bacterium]